jgi:hypothetical protein
LYGFFGLFLFLGRGGIEFLGQFLATTIHRDV